MDSTFLSERETRKRFRNGVITVRLLSRKLNFPSFLPDILQSLGFEHHGLEVIFDNLEKVIVDRYPDGIHATLFRDLDSSWHLAGNRRCVCGKTFGDLIDVNPGPYCPILNDCKSFAYKTFEENARKITNDGGYCYDDNVDDCHRLCAESRNTYLSFRPTTLLITKRNYCDPTVISLVQHCEDHTIPIYDNCTEYLYRTVQQNIRYLRQHRKRWNTATGALATQDTTFLGNSLKDIPAAENDVGTRNNLEDDTPMDAASRPSHLRTKSLNGKDKPAAINDVGTRNNLEDDKPMDALSRPSQLRTKALNGKDIPAAENDVGTRNNLEDDTLMDAASRPSHLRTKALNGKDIPAAENDVGTRNNLEDDTPMDAASRPSHLRTKAMNGKDIPAAENDVGTRNNLKDDTPIDASSRPSHLRTKALKGFSRSRLLDSLNYVRKCLESSVQPFKECLRKAKATPYYYNGVYHPLVIWAESSGVCLVCGMLFRR